MRTVGKAISFGVLGLLLGLVLTPLVSVFLLQTPVEEGTAGCVGLALGIVLFAASLWYQTARKKSSEKS
jgi:hypothetical protein